MSDRLLLEIEGGGRPPAELPRAGRLLVGSDPKRADFVVVAPGVADVHCAIGKTKDGGFAIKDLGAEGGVLVNGKRVELQRLNAGDVLTLGTARLRVVDPERAREPAATPPRPAAPPTPAPAPAQSAAVPAQIEPQAPATPASSATRTAPLPAIAGYRIEKEVGRGGMGRVFLAVQTSLDRRVALKVLAAKFEADADFVRRFQAEARAAAALAHPNVVTVYDVGEDKGTHYLSMEYMDEGTLEDRVQREGKLPLREVLDIVRDAAAGLVYAESKGIVHRDLKPANLMRNSVGQTKIADLGLATHVEAEEAQAGDKKVFGTPHFMSPEQARGEKLDHRSDLYSLGATAYRLVTGHTPFEGKDAREIVRSVLRDEPRPMRDYVPDVPQGVVAFVERAMKKDPLQRHASAAEALRELETLRATLFPAAHAQPSTAAQPRSRSGVVVLVLIAALGAGGYWFWKSKQDENASTAQRPTRDDPSTEPRNDPLGRTAQPEAPAVEPQKPGATVVTSAEKDDKDLQLLEANARVALLELVSREMSATDRRDELRILAARFQGTSAATEALEKASAISAELVGAEAAANLRKAEIEQVMTRLRSAAQLERTPPDPGKSLLAMRAVAGQETVAEDPIYLAEKKKLEESVMQAAVRYANDVLASANRSLEKGDVEAAKRELTALEPIFMLPDFPLGQSPVGTNDLFETGRRVRERLHNLDFAAATIGKKQAREDAGAIATAFAGQTGLERELRAFDLDAARARLAKLAGALKTKDAQDSVAALAQDCADARAALDTLAREWSAGGWRRKSFVDPRDKKGATKNATGVDADGLLFDEGGAPQRVPWSAFGGRTDELSKLFFERLTREWSDVELRQISAALRLCACVEATTLTAKMLDRDKRANFTESNQREVLGAFAIAEQWQAKASGGGERMARESAAAQLLCEVMRQSTESRWSTAVASLERLIGEFDDTLLVRLMSDGTPPDAVSKEVDGKPAPGAGGPDGAKERDH